MFLNLGKKKKTIYPQIISHIHFTLVFGKDANWDWTFWNICFSSYVKSQFIVNKKISALNFSKFWVTCILIPKLKNNIQPNILNFFERVLFLLTINEKINRKIDLHIQKSSIVDCTLLKY